MSLVNLIHSDRFSIAPYRDSLERDSIACVSVATLADLSRHSTGELMVVLLDRSLAGSLSNAWVPLSGMALLSLGLGELPAGVSPEDVYLELPSDPTPTLLTSAVRRAHQYLDQKRRTSSLESQLLERNRQLEQVNDIGIALSAERDHSRLLDMILRKSRALSRSDAGSLYLLDELPQEGKILRWKLAQNDSIAVDFQEKVLPITRKSLAGYVALTGETLVIDDAYELTDEAEYTINRSFDVKNGYRTKSMLVLPMNNHQGDIIGVLQLINRKRTNAPEIVTAENVEDCVISFDEQTIDIMSSLAGQAAVAVENNGLYESIERLFEGFVTASVTAIEQRDPTTSGHSFRVAELTVELAKTVDAASSGPFASDSFTVDQIREIRYASLLHDFGKVGVREQVLVKVKKLYPLQLEGIRSRFDYAMKALEAAHYRRKVDYLLAGNSDASVLKGMESDLQQELDSLRQDLTVILQSNEPSLLAEGNFEHLQRLNKRTYEDFGGSRRQLLTDEEIISLSVRRGNLGSDERNEMQSHVSHTFRFLSKIPWTRDLRNVPQIAYAHHEKVNGKGYPRGLTAAEIPIQARMMTITDIYDALTAKDRPYKKAVPRDRALDILQAEVSEGLLDRSLFEVFLEAKVYERVGESSA